MTRPTDLVQRDLYARIVADEFADGPNGRIVFVVSTRSLDEGRGDLFVAVGLAKYLIREGWGVAFFPMSDWGGEIDAGASAVIVMLESFVPGLIPASAVRIAWVRNWTEKWAELPYLDAFDEVWASSGSAADVLRARFDGDVRVIPIAADLELFDVPAAPEQFELVTTVNDWGKPREILGAIDGLPEGTVVHWFGHGAHGSSAGRVVHRGPVSYFSLPGLYAESTLVVDDVIGPAATYGMHNSRLFEAIAAGALPITNVELGLDELGLGALPHYHDADSLSTVIQRFRDDPSTRARVLAEVRAVVAARHSFAVRASEVSRHVTAAVARVGDRSERSEMLAWAAHERAALIGSQVHARVLDNTLAVVNADRDRLSTVAEERAAEIRVLHEHLDVLRDEVAHPIRRRLGRLRARVMRRRR